MKKIYKTTVVSAKKQKIISIHTPDDDNNWNLFSITVNKNKIYYHWVSDVEFTVTRTTFSSSDEDFKKTLDIVQESIDSKNLNNEIK